MSQFYKVLKADPLGEPYTPSFAGAKPTQTYWCQLEGVDKDVSIGKQVGNTLTPGEHIYGDLMYAKSQKGTEYWKFKSQKVPEGVQRPASSPAQATAQQATGVDMSAKMPDWFQPWANLLTKMAKDMQALKGFVDEDEEPVAEPTPEPTPEPAKVEQLSGEPIDEETQQTLDNIFGGEPEPPQDAEDATK